jgi:hypothetical protein
MEFTTLKEFKKAYEEVRNDILVRHGYKPGDKVRLNNVIQLWQKFNDTWVKAGTVKSDMEDRIKMYQNNGVFKLTARV